MMTLIDRLQTFNQHRLPKLVAFKYRAMRANPFAFFRGTNHLFYEDWPAASPLNAAPLVWACGDLHLENFGVYKGENRLTYFDLNDLDDGALAPCTWDLARFLTSLHVAAAILKLSEKDANRLGADFLETYFSTLAEGCIASLERATATGLIKQLMRTLKNRTRQQFLDEHSSLGKKGRQFKLETDRYDEVSKDEKKLVRAAIHMLGEQTNREKFFEVHAVAFRVAGTSSLGLRRYAVLVEGRGSPGENFILDLKEARPSALVPHLDIPQPAWPSPAHRAVALQMRLQARPPALLAPLEIDGRWYVLRELQPAQDKLDLTAWDKHPDRVKKVAESMAAIVAWGQLRSGGRNGSAIADELIAFGEQAALRAPLLEYARQYAGQVLTDYENFAEAYDAGKLA